MMKLRLRYYQSKVTNKNIKSTLSVFNLLANKLLIKKVNNIYISRTKPMYAIRILSTLIAENAFCFESKMDHIVRFCRYMLF